MAAYFTPKTLTFLRQLEKNNTKEWFSDHKDTYEKQVREPALRLIADLDAPLQAISPRYHAVAKKVGGSLFRVMRDTRFEHGEGPYKPWIGLRFHHERSRDVHAPGFFVHLAHGHGSFMGGGLWKPESKDLQRLRQFMVDNPRSWEKVKKALPDLFAFDEESRLTRPPRGFDPAHPLMDDLRLRSFTATRDFGETIMLSPDLKDTIVEAMTTVAPLVDYLCAALELDF
jgi:uncharacterized protein (TIGR02453 family)